MKGRAIAVNNDIFCREKGAVSPDYVCSNHRYSPDSKKARESSNKCIDCEFFTIDGVNTGEAAITGCCKLFSVRKFDGTQKNACSKFTKREKQEVS